MTDLKKLVKTIKNLIKNDGESSFTLIDVDGNEITFSVATENDIVSGVGANPDGVFTFSDGKVITIENGVVTSVAEVAKEPEPQNDETPDGKDALIAELQARVAELTAMIEEANKVAKEKEAEIEEVAGELEEIKNFYSKVNGVKERKEVKNNLQSNGFKFSKK